MIPSFSRNTILHFVSRWIHTLKFAPSLSPVCKEQSKPTPVAPEQRVEPMRAAVAAEKEEEADLQRNMFTGNFCAGPVALIHPRLLKTMTKL